MMGREHVAILAASAAARLVIACDIDPTARERLPAEVPLVTDLDHALDAKGLEAVIVATPPEHHRTTVEAAIERGLAVLCEKPIAGSLSDADAIVELGARPGAHLVIGHMLRFDPRYRAIADAVNAGRLGRPIQLTMRGNVPDFEGRALAGRISLSVENLVHAYDLWQWLCGPIVRVHGEASATDVLGPGIVDSIVVTVRFASGAVGSLASAWNMPSRLGYTSEHFFSLLGSEGLAWIDGRDSGAGIVGPDLTSFPWMVSWSDPAGVPYGLFRTEVEHFLAGVRDGRPWPVSLPEARSALAVALAVDESIDTGQPVSIAA
jgi:predicted dehydrogenase